MTPPIYSQKFPMCEDLSLISQDPASQSCETDPSIPTVLQSPTFVRWASSFQDKNRTSNREMSFDTVKTLFVTAANMAGSHAAKKVSKDLGIPVRMTNESAAAIEMFFSSFGEAAGKSLAHSLNEYLGLPVDQNRP